MLDLKFAELHSPLFLAGKNFGVKLDPTKLTGLKLNYDRAEKELHVHWAGEMAILPSSSVSSMTEGVLIEKAPSLHPIVAGQAGAQAGELRIAQASSPTSHVHAGPGFGKTGKDK